MSDILTQRIYLLPQQTNPSSLDWLVFDDGVTVTKVAVDALQQRLVADGLLDSNSLDPYQTETEADLKYLLKTSASVDSERLGGELPGFYAADSKFDDYLTETESDLKYLLKNGTAYNSTRLDGFLSSDFAKLTDLDDYIASVEKGAANGVAPLDSGGKVPEQYFPDSILGQVTYKGTFDPNTDVLPDATTSTGWYYIASDSGVNEGIQFNTGDWAISNGTTWQKVDNTDAVSSVFGRVGNVLANVGDYSAFYLGINATADDSDKLGGQLPSYYATASGLSDYVSKTATGTEIMAGSLVVHDVLAVRKSDDSYSLQIAEDETSVRDWLIKSASSADHNLTMKNTATGAFNLTVGGAVYGNIFRTNSAQSTDANALVRYDTLTSGLGDYVSKTATADQSIISGLNIGVDLEVSESTTSGNAKMETWRGNSSYAVFGHKDVLDAGVVAEANYPFMSQSDSSVYMASFDDERNVRYAFDGDRASNKIMHTMQYTPASGDSQHEFTGTARFQDALTGTTADFSGTLKADTIASTMANKPSLWADGNYAYLLTADQVQAYNDGTVRIQMTFEASATYYGISGGTILRDYNTNTDNYLGLVSGKKYYMQAFCYDETTYSSLTVYIDWSSSNGYYIKFGGGVITTGHTYVINAVFSKD